MFRLADGELRGVDADRQPARARREVVAGQRALAALVQFAAAREGQRVGRNDQARRAGAPTPRLAAVGTGS